MQSGDHVTFGSVCSGIEAASVAWEPLGWRAAWLAEIEPFPSAVLAHHYANVTNLGDMTTIAQRVLSGEVAAPDVLVGGTPCQAFSVAGLRAGLDDQRGQLTLRFMELANAIDAVRIAAGKPACIILWENVPGVLSDKTNAFGCFLGGLAGEDGELKPSGKKWSNAGAVYGPERAIAWRVLDAQYFRVAQRRRRVFVVASARDGFDPIQLLFDAEGVRRDTAPRREPGQGFTHDVAPCLTSGGRGVERAGETRGQDPVVAVTGNVSHTLSAEGFDASEDGTGRGTPIICMAHGQGGAEISADRSPTLACNHEAPIAAYSVALRGRDGGNTAELGGDVVGYLRAGGGGSDKAHVLAFSCKDNGRDATPDLSPTLRSMAHAASHQNGGGQIAVCFAENSRSELRLEGSDGQRTGALSTGGGKPGQGQPVVAYGIPGNWIGRKPENGGNAVAPMHDVAPCQTKTDQHGVSVGMHVRRLTPRECERLQGFPDDYTLIRHRKKPAADGPRYKALGNSMAVPCMRWLGTRIKNYLNRVERTVAEPFMSVKTRESNV